MEGKIVMFKNFAYLCTILSIGLTAPLWSVNPLDLPSYELMEDEGFLMLEGELEDLIEEEETYCRQAQKNSHNHVDESYEEPGLHQHTPPLPVRQQKQGPLIRQASPDPITVQEAKRILPSFPVELDQIVEEDPEASLASLPQIDAIQAQTAEAVQKIEISLKQVFAGSPIIYSLLFILSIITVCIWLYSILTIRSFEFLPPQMIKDLRTKLISNQFDEALDICVKQKHFFCRMLASGILARKHGLPSMIDTMKSEGRRCTIAFWQRINILNEIAIIAPMIGLLGTVLGMFYAFYDLNRSMESVSLLFDGLGISVGTTVAGLVVAILAMILHSMAKYRLVRILADVENEAQTFAALIDSRGANFYLGK